VAHEWARGLQDQLPVGAGTRKRYTSALPYPKLAAVRVPVGKILRHCPASTLINVGRFRENGAWAG
jgi:hypothetical protein